MNKGLLDDIPLCNKERDKVFTCQTQGKKHLTNPICDIVKALQV